MANIDTRTISRYLTSSFLDSLQKNLLPLEHDLVQIDISECLNETILDELTEQLMKQGMADSGELNHIGEDIESYKIFLA